MFCLLAVLFIKYFVFLKWIERQKFDNALASPNDQMVPSVQVVCVLFLLTVSLNLNSAASKSVIFSPSSEAQYDSAL